MTGYVLRENSDLRSWGVLSLGGWECTIAQRQPQGHAAGLGERQRCGLRFSIVPKAWATL